MDPKVERLRVSRSDLLSTVDRHEQRSELGKTELGRYAFESHMPAKIFHNLSKEDDSNNTYGAIPLLKDLLETSQNVTIAHLCSPDAVQVSKIPNEGGNFCGYRNIQMLLLSLESADRRKFAPRKPTIPVIQDMIEDAWDANINSHSRVQAGGVRGTRKHIGTSEVRLAPSRIHHHGRWLSFETYSLPTIYGQAEAILLHHSIPCTGTAFHGHEAWVRLLDYVETYFSSPFFHVSTATKDKVIQTTLPSIFLQRPHHSITIIGIEQTKSGKRRLLAFDPAWKPPKQMTRSQTSKSNSRWSAYWTLKRYRKGERYLKRFTRFETLVVDKVPR